MGKYLNVYKDKAAYDADEARKGLKASTVSLIGHDVVFDGYNTEVTSPSIGDAVYHDGDNTVRFIKHGTLDKSLLPSDYKPIGVCGKRWGSKIFIINGENAAKKFAEFYVWKASGWATDGADHSCDVKNYDGKIPAPFVYNSTTVQGCVDQLNAWFAANKPGGKEYVARLEDNETIIQLMDFNSWKDYSLSISSLTVTSITATDIPVSGRVETPAGAVYPVWNLEKAKEYFKQDITSSAYNPTSPVSSIPSYPVCLPAYLGTSAHRDKDMCVWLRGKFGEGEQGWFNYMSQITPKNPFPKGMMSEDYGTGKRNTYVLVGKKAPNKEGNLVSLYPAADYAASKGYPGVKGLEEGDWFGLNASEFIYLFNDIRYGLSGVSASNSDPINETLSAMGMTQISCGLSSWLFSRHGSSFCWGAHSLGYVDGNGFYGSSRVVPAALYELCSD